MRCAGDSGRDCESFSGSDWGEDGAAEGPKEKSGHATRSRGDGCREGAGVACTVKNENAVLFVVAVVVVAGVMCGLNQERICFQLYSDCVSSLSTVWREP